MPQWPGNVPYQSGDILLASLDPVTGHEQGGRRPVLVISGSSYNELRNEHLIVTAITSRARGLPFHVAVGTDSGLRTPSWIQAESVRAISAQRVIRQLGRARPETVAEVRNWVANFLRDW
jgi:mRNA interferase MazF